MKPMVRTVLMAALLGGALAPTCASAQSAPMTIAATPEAPILSLSITEEVRARPDIASIGAGVTTRAPTATEAMRQNSAAMAELVDAIKARGVKAEDIQTTGVNLNAQYDYEPQQRGLPPRFIGYEVSNMVRVTTSDIDGIGGMLDALVQAGGTNLDGPSFGVRDREAMLSTARAAAIAKLGAKARDYARLAGYRDAQLVTLAEGGGYSGPMPVLQTMAPRAAMADAKAIVEPGRVTDGLTLSATYRLVR